MTPTKDHCLNGITRSKALLVCDKNGIFYKETDFIFEDFWFLSDMI